MPHFNAKGEDVVLCQVCGLDTTTPTWRPDITGHASAGNVCQECLEAFEKKAVSGEVFSRGGPIGLYEHCRRESGLTKHADIMAYLNRHYGHE